MNIPASENIYTTKYADFKGVDFTSQICSRQRFPKAKNFIISDMVEKRPGWKVLKKFDGLKINGIYSTIITVEKEENSEHTSFYLIHAGDKLYSLTDFEAEPTLLLENINDDKSSGFYANNSYFILTGEEYICFDGEKCWVINEYTYNTPYVVPEGASGVKDGKTYTEINGAISLPCEFKIKEKNIPILYTGSEKANINSSDVGNYEEFTGKVNTTEEERNLLTGWGCIEYSSLSACAEYGPTSSLLNFYVIPPDAIKRGACIIEFSDGSQRIKSSESVGSSSWPDSIKYITIFEEEWKDGNISPSNVGNPFKIYYQLDKEKNTDNQIYKSKISNYIQYGNGVYYFFTGNKAHPNRDWQSELNNPLFISGDKYTVYGTEDEILGYGQYGEYLAVFKKGNIDTNIYIRSVQDLGDLGIAFPVSIGVGGALGGINHRTIFNMDGETLYLTNQGIYALTSLSLTNMKVTRNRSYFVDGLLLKEKNLKNAISCTYKQKYILCVDSRCYILDGTQSKKYIDSTNNEYAYECLYWDNIPASAFLSTADKLYFGTENGEICVFTEDEYFDGDNPTEMIISTMLDDDGDFMALKKMKKKGTGLLVKPYMRSSFDISFLYDTYAETRVKTAYADIFDFENVDFDRFTFETSQNPRIIPFLKKSKKYKSIQIILKSSEPEPLGIIEIVKRFTFNNYVKRS